MKGLFISFEGVDGCGKSTQIRLLSDYLSGLGYEVLATREPGGCSISEKIREILLNIENTQITNKTEALLYAASRTQLVEEVITPAVNDGKIVLCDRFLDSSLAYQGYGRELGIENVYSINEFGIGDMMPYKTFFLDYPPELAFKRMSHNRVHDRLETQSFDFYQKLYNGFKKLTELYPDRFVTVDCRGDKQQTQLIIQHEIDTILNAYF